MAQEQPTTAPVAAKNVSTVVSELRGTFYDTPWTGWIILAGGIFAGMVAGKVVQVLLSGFANRLRARQRKAWAVLVDAASKPASLTLITGGLSIGLTSIVLTPEVRLFVTRILVLMFTLAMAWFLFNAVGLLDLVLHRLANRTDSLLDDQVVPLISRTVRLFTVVVFVLFTAQNVFGADITAWLAGLGIAGLAVSLAAQDSIKNLFGSITIFMDRAFAVGDRVIFVGHDGIVDEIGFRSTKLRTADGAIVTIPNAKIVDNTVVRVGRPTTIQRTINLPLPRATPANKVEEVLGLVRNMLAEPDIAAGFDLPASPPRVTLSDVGRDGSNVTVTYWFHSTDQAKYLEHAERINLKLLGALQKAQIA